MNLQLAYRYILTLSKNESMFKKKKRLRKKKKRFPPAGIESQTFDM